MNKFYRFDESSIRRWLAAGLMLLILLCGSALAQSLPNLGDVDREELSPAVEGRLGEHIMSELRRDRDYLDDAPLLEYLNQLGTKLVDTHPEARGDANYAFYFFAVRDPTLNAFALPGGYIGVHSALILAAQNESELASVLAHEIGHVAQRHIARMLGQQRQDALIPLATGILAALASRAGGDATAAVLLGGQGLAVQRQLNFSRDAEREADRVGLQIMRDSGFDSAGMIAFFSRLQTAARSYTDNAPAFLRSHPLTTERIADIQARTREFPYRQHADSVDFDLIRARVQVLQDDTPQGWRAAAVRFNRELDTRRQSAAAEYGLALISLRQQQAASARQHLQRAAAVLPNADKSATPSVLVNSLLASLAIEIELAAQQADTAVKLSTAARQRFPLSRGIAWQYADALLATGRQREALEYLLDQLQSYRQEPELQQRLAQVYAASGKKAAQHRALAEEYALRGSLPAALDQLRLARAASDASFYDQAQIDARERELQAQWKDELKEKK